MGKPWGVGKKPWRVEVEWEDSTLLPAGWERVTDILLRRHVVQCNSAGFLLADDKRGVVLASGVHRGEAHGVVIIPRGAIHKVRRLR